MKTSNPLKWHGGKSYLAKWIISHMPEHTHYVEPFFGGGAVLFARTGEGVSEVVNDVNQDLINFWSVLSSPDHYGEFERLVSMTPFSEDEFREACEAARLPHTIPDIERAGEFFVRYRQSRQGLGKDFATLSRNRTRRGMNEQVSAWLSAIDGLPEAHERLRRVVVLNSPAVEVIKQQDGPDTLFYCDPPYLHETRNTTSDYEFEMSEADHIDLLETLANIKGKFLLSGYPSELYQSHADANGWTCEMMQIDNKASSKKTKEQKTECLWRNY